jgi:diaminohydroxyphosphoribosylaminopyrimidine deaminase / 5-amino-6-(5-phosphoribosylamino)uracil reductase
VGAHTVSVDNPRLDTRYFGGVAPIRVVVGTPRGVDDSFHIFDGSVRTVVYGKNLLGVCVDGLEFREVEGGLEGILEDLFLVEEVGSLFVEGGASILNSFIEAGLWDEIRVIRSSLGLFLDDGDVSLGVGAPSLAGLSPYLIEEVDDDVLLGFVP